MAELVSVVVPVYNMEASLEKCVRSILEQQDVDFEVILVDDGSIDHSWQCCQNLAKSDSRVRIYHTDNHGSGPARNHGIEKARGRYIYFPDADDTLVPHALSLMLEKMKKNNADLLVFGYQVLDQNGIVRRSKTYPEFIRDGHDVRMNYSDFAGQKTKYGIQGAPWNKLFDANLIRQFKIQYPPLRRHQDEAFIASYVCHSSRIQFIEDVLYTHYQNTFTLEWKKFPKDYVDIVHQLYETRKETILVWNPLDKKTHQVIHEEYVDDLIKAFELSFSPKHTFSPGQRWQWMRNHIESSGICAFEIYNDYSIYKKILLHLFRKKLYFLAAGIIRIKVTADQIGLDHMSKKYH